MGGLIRMGHGVKVEVWGNLALFGRPEFKTERVSYDMITPSAARGLLEAIYWKPAIRYVIDKIHVLNPIEFTNIRRNEVKVKASAKSVQKAINNQCSLPFISTSGNIHQRASLVLKNVHYVIEAHFVMTEQAGEQDNQEKHYAILMRRLQKGQCFHQPCFGCREFPANFRLWQEGESQAAYQGQEKDLGYLLYDLDFSNLADIQPIFFRAVLRDGVLDLADQEVHR